MGSYTFRWEHPADEVWVTGTFDKWSKSTRLDKVEGGYEKLITFPTDDKVLYKFVADGDWKYDHTHRMETDHEGNVNNVLYPEDIRAGYRVPNISSVGPGATTAALAGVQPLLSESTPGAFPVTPVGEENSELSVKPIPASSGLGNPIQLAPGEPVPPPSAINNNTISSGVHDDPELVSKEQELQQTVGVAPIPATGGLGNPITLAPGEKVPDPSTLTSNTVDSTVKLDPASYEKSDAGAPVNAPAGSDAAATSAVGGALFGLGPQTTNMIPESSMPRGVDAPADISKVDVADPTISSVAPGSTTAQLAGQVPLEPRGTAQVISDDSEKKDDGFMGKAIAGASALGVGAAGAAVAANELLKDKTGVDAKSKLPESVQNTIDSNATSATTATAAAPPVPEEVVASQKAAAESPEAAANPQAVMEKSAVEKELLSEIPKSTATGESAPTAAVAAAAVPAAVVASQAQVSEGAEAAANPVAVEEKSAMEKELLSEVKPTEAAGEPAPVAAAAAATTAPAPTTEGMPATHATIVSPVTTEPVAASAVETTEDSTVPRATTAAPQLSATGAPQIGHPTGGGLEPLDMQKPTETPATPAVPATAEQTTPAITTGVAAATAPAVSTPSPSTPSKRQSIVGRFKQTPDSSKKEATPSTPDSKKEKRRSWFGRMKDKLKG